MTDSTGTCIASTGAKTLRSSSLVRSAPIVDRPALGALDALPAAGVQVST